MTTHLTDDQMLDVLYGLASAAQIEHARACPECSGLRLELDAMRHAQTQIRPVTSAALDHQREAIVARISGNCEMGWAMPMLAGSALAAGLLLAGFVTYGPLAPTARVAQQQVAEVREEPDLAELLSVEYTAEAQAAVPLRGLFETIAEEK